MSEPIDWRALRAQGQAHSENLSAQYAKKGSVNRDWFGAAHSAAQWAKQDDLHPAIDEYGESRYTIQQGLKAACHGREDIAAILVIQHALLRRLQGLRVLGWACFAVLCYIAIRLS